MRTGVYVSILFYIEKTNFFQKEKTSLGAISLSFEAPSPLRAWEDGRAKLSRLPSPKKGA